MIFVGRFSPCSKCIADTTAANFVEIAATISGSAKDSLILCSTSTKREAMEFFMRCLFSSSQLKIH